MPLLFTLDNGDSERELQEHEYPSANDTALFVQDHSCQGECKEDETNAQTV